MGALSSTMTASPFTSSQQPRPPPVEESSISPTAASSKQHRRYQSEVPDLSPFSTLSCQVQATNAWRRDLKSLFSRASERFADVSWAVGGGDGGTSESGDETDGEADETNTISTASHRPPEGIIWAHKAILYARAPNTFQARYLQLQSPAVNLGAMASSSQVSLPILRAPSPDASILSKTSSMSRSRMRVRGAAPPSSFTKERIGKKGKRLSSSSSSSDAPVASDSENEGPGEGLRRKGSRGLFSSNTGSTIEISRPSSQNTFRSESLSVISATSTIKGPMRLEGESQAFFEAMLEYLYTAEESMVEAFEFLYEDRISAGGNVEERLEKLRQDLVFMWRSRLYSDVQVVLGEGDEQAAVGTIPDGNASVLSFPIGEPDYADADEEETACFSAHRMILASRSPYFAALLLSPYADQTSTTLRLPSPPFTPAALHFALGFLYTGTLFFSNRTFDLATAFQLWRAGAYLQVETLQNLVASLIANDFCHGFRCWPPCKTCVKRVPRTLAFACAPDVVDAYLKTLAIDAVSGLSFGIYWSKDVGNLDQTTRASIVSNIKSRIDQHPGHIVSALRQLSIVGTRIDMERSSRWVDSLRLMCESVESHIAAKLGADLEVLIKTEEWMELVEGVGFNNDVLERALIILVDGLNERRAASIYQTLVGQVLLREEGLPSESIREILEEARGGIIRYLKRRWVSARALAAFNMLERWALKELADELDVPSTDLLLPNDETATTSTPALRSRTGLQAAVVRPSAVVQRPSIGPSKGRPVRAVGSAPGDLVDGEREAGPIHMRAAVLNRNAARLSATQGFRSGTADTNVQASAAAVEGQKSPSVRSGSVMSRPRGSLRGTPSEIDQTMSRASVSADSIRSNASGKGSAQQSLSNVSLADARSVASRSRSRTPTAAASVASSIVAGSSSARQPSGDGPTTPKASRISSGPRTSASSVQSKTTSTSRPLIKPAPSSSTPTAGAASSTSASTKANLRPAASNGSLRSVKNEGGQPSSDRAASIANFRARGSPQNTPQTAAQAKTDASPATIRVKRGTPTTSSTNDSALSKTPRRTSSSSSLGSTKSLRKVASRQALPVGSVKAKVAAISSSSNAPPPPVPAIRKGVTPLSDVTKLKIQQRVSSPSAMDVDPQYFNKVTLAGYEGTVLSLGIPCVIAPRCANGHQLKAVVKYLGPIAQRQGPWVGVEVSLPIPTEIEEASLRLNDGTLDGHRYFDVGTSCSSSTKSTALTRNGGESSPPPEREARRRRIARMTARPAKDLASWEKTPPKAHLALKVPPPSFSVAPAAAAAAAADDQDSPLPIGSEEGAPPSAKRRKDLGGLGLGDIHSSAAEETGSSRRGLFLRPNEVLWLVT